MSLIIQVLGDHKFGDDDRIVIEWGTTSKTLQPQPVDVGLYGLDSILPHSGPATSGSNST